jgi:hypothetical protein
MDNAEARNKTNLLPRFDYGICLMTRFQIGGTWTNALDAHSADRSSTRWLVPLLVVLGLIPLWFFLRRFIESDFIALAVTMPDDSYYYLLPAWHFKAHGYFTFDGLHKTYGFQPLYMVVLAALSCVLPSIEAVFRAGLCLNAILHVSTGVLVGLAVNNALPGPAAIVRYVVAIVAATVYWLGSNRFWANVTLMENPLAAFVYVLAILCMLRALSAPQRRSFRADAWLGFVIGSIVLTRLLPSSLLAFGVMLLIAWLFLPRRSAAVINATALVPLLVWGAYAWVVFGHVLPTSMAVKTGGGVVLGAVRHWRSVPLAEMSRWIGWYVRWAISFLTDRWVADPARLVFLVHAGFVGLGLVGLIVCAASARWWSPGRMMLVLLAVASAAGVLAIPILLYNATPLLLTYSSWYLFDVVAILAIASGAALGYLGQQAAAYVSARWAGPRPGVGILVIGVLCIVSAAVEMRGFRNVAPLGSWEYSRSNWASIVAKNTTLFRSAVSLGKDERIGSLNAGLVALLLLRDGVINLDGLANDDIVEYLRHGGTFGDYVSRERIRYIIDFYSPADLEKNFGLKAELLMKSEALLETAGCPKCTGMVLYLVRVT